MCFEHVPGYVQVHVYVLWLYIHLQVAENEMVDLSVMFPCLRARRKGASPHGRLKGLAYFTTLSHPFDQLIEASCPRSQGCSFSCLNLNALSSAGTPLGSLPATSPLSSIPISSGTDISGIHFPVLPFITPIPTGSVMTGTHTPVLDLSLSVSMQPVPARVVNLIHCGRFIDMCDLLRDNAAVREVNSLPS